MNTKEQQIRQYLEEKVDPFLKPLLMDIMKKQPKDVHEFMVDWVDNRGKQINEDLKVDKRDPSKSQVYDDVKKSVIEEVQEAK